VTDEEARVTLAVQAKALADTVGVLAKAVDQLDKRATKGERINVWVSLGLAVDLVLSIAVALVVSGLVGVIDRERSTRQDAMCPLYSLLLGSYNPSSRAEGGDRDTYNQVFITLQRSYDSLDCDDPIAPPRVDQPPATIPVR
jgi:hypothetical protein